MIVKPKLYPQGVVNGEKVLKLGGYLFNDIKVKVKLRNLERVKYHAKLRMLIKYLI